MMVTYLLLRDNKENGPYSFDELVAVGLKPYDLIWVQGKSAAWRYPGEVPELAPYAPMVEEQPYDRFFKKEEPQQHFSLSQPQVSHSPAKKIEPPKSDNHEAYKPRPSVFVTMPNAETNKPIPSTSSKPVAEAPAQPVQPTIVVTENPAAAQIKYSQPLDEIKEMYVKTLQERKQKIAYRSLAIQSLKKASVILLFVATGVVAGFMIKTNKDADGIVKSSVANEPRQEVSGLENNLPDVNELNLHGGDALLSIPNENNSGQNDNEPVAQMEVRRESPKADLQKQLLTSGSSSTEKEIASHYEFEATETDVSSGERKSKSRENSPIEKENSLSFESPDRLQAESKQKSAIFSDVSVSSNDYRVVAFGGIRDLQLTVTNDSKFPLDEVIVELQYLKPSEQPLRTENIRFKSIAPNTSSTIKIPDTNRGIKVSYRILNVKADVPGKTGM